MNFRTNIILLNVFTLFMPPKRWMLKAPPLIPRDYDVIQVGQNITACCKKDSHVYYLSFVLNQLKAAVNFNCTLWPSSTTTTNYFLIKLLLLWFDQETLKVPEIYTPDYLFTFSWKKSSKNWTIFKSSILLSEGFFLGAF